MGTTDQDNLVIIYAGAVLLGMSCATSYGGERGDMPISANERATAQERGTT